MRTDSASPLPLWVPALLCTLGLALLLLSCGSVCQTLFLLSFGARTTGTIVGTWGDGSGEGNLSYPVIEFKDAAGKTWSGQSHWSITPGSRDRNVGSKIAVLYDPGRPGRFAEDSFEGLWVLPLVTGLMGSGALAFGMIAQAIRRGSLGKGQAA
jgi:hypothetical protein